MKIGVKPPDKCVQYSQFSFFSLDRAPPEGNLHRHRENKHNYTAPLVNKNMFLNQEDILKAMSTRGALIYDSQQVD